MLVKFQYIVLLIIVLSIIIVFTIALYTTYVKKILKERKIQHQLELEHQKEVAMQYNRVQENERKRIAEVLHDDVGNQLNILSLWVNNEDTWNSKRSKEIVAKQIPILIETTRAISHSLYPVSLEKFGLLLTIESLISNVNKSLSVQLFLTHNYLQRSVSFELQVYRIIQEFLSNVIKHAKATKMLITIRDSKQFLALILSDNGVGFDIYKHQKGMGLENIESRIETINAVSKWKSKKGKGVRLIIIIKPKK